MGKSTTRSKAATRLPMDELAAARLEDEEAESPPEPWRACSPRLLLGGALVVSGVVIFGFSLEMEENVLARPEPPSAPPGTPPVPVSPLRPRSPPPPAPKLPRWPYPEPHPPPGLPPPALPLQLAVLPPPDVAEGSVLAEIQRRFEQGHPSNDLAEAGVLIHAFDQHLSAAEPWHVEREGWQARSSGALSCSIVYAGRTTVYASEGGIVLHPATRIRCACTPLPAAPDTVSKLAPR